VQLSGENTLGFFTGRVTATRYRARGRAPRSFGPDHLEQLAGHAIGKQRVASGDGVEIGWIAGDHILDTGFELAKNIVNDCLHFEMRIDQQKIPGDLLRAYTQVELQGLAAANPSGRPSARQKREARQIARERLETEAADGRYLRRKSFPILWDGLSNELLVGTTSTTVVDRLHTLFQNTFDRGFELYGAGRQAFFQAEGRGQSRGVDDAAPSAFVAGQPLADLAWLPDQDNRDFLGNEFLLWLWWVLDQESDALELADKSEATVLLTRTLQLECPRGQTGKESITSDAPTRLPEARRAIQSGKLPRKVGAIINRHDQQYELTLHAETLAFTGAKLPAPEEDDDRARLEARVGQLRHLLETLDLLYDAFGTRRFGAGWNKELARIQKWLAGDEHGRRSALA
jgi:hypothetical protein